MAAAEIYDYVEDATADYDYTLSISAQGNVTEDGGMNQVVHLADDNSEERITLAAGAIFSVSWSYTLLSESESGTVFDLYFDPLKACGIFHSFKWLGHDGHTYVVRFDCALSRVGNNVARWGTKDIKLKILGRVAA